MRGMREMMRMVPKMASSIVALRYAAMAAPMMAPEVCNPVLDVCGCGAAGGCYYRDDARSDGIVDVYA